jgi:AraC family transcriptional regulator, regulatory protein of adaptative response / DNA-3-methyladenine glycosylase II
MVLDADGCFRALRARDARFDGVFFAAIKSTGIYCRPICPARHARRENCLFFDTAAAAERHGFRPCLRCRPEIAPGNARVDAVGRIATSALARIEAGAMNERSVDSLAAEFGITSRHLRRAVESEFGVSPVEIAQTQRLLLAKQLLTETALPVTDVAFASGFASLRRFNALFKQRYRLNPTQLRGRRVTEAGESVTCELGYRAPLDWNSMLTFLGARACAGVEAIAAGRYLRTVALGKHRGWIAVSRSAKHESLRIEVSASLVPVLAVVLARLKRLFDLGAHPLLIEDRLRQDARLKPMVDAWPGLRVPGAFDGFEMALRAILGQQVSVKAATTIHGRFADKFGGLIETPHAALTRLPASADAVARATVQEIRALGVTGARAESVLALARASASGQLTLEPGAGVENTIAALQTLPGVGAWTAQYIAMRALRWPDAFPHTDLGVYKALGTRSAKEALAAAAEWSPWRAYAVMYLWKGLEKK